MVVPPSKAGDRTSLPDDKLVKSAFELFLFSSFKKFPYMSLQEKSSARLMATAAARPKRVRAFFIIMLFILHFKLIQDSRTNSDVLEQG